MPAFAQDAERTVEVIDLSGALDGRIIDFAIEAIEAAADAGVEVVILQVDSPGVIGGEDRLRMLIDLVASPPVPVVAWVGPSPARAHGGAGQIVLAADRAFADWWYIKDPTHIAFYAEQTLAWIAARFGWALERPAPTVVLYRKPEMAKAPGAVPGLSRCT